MRKGSEVLLVAADDTVRDRLAREIEARGYEVTALTDTASARRLLDLGRQPCVIVMFSSSPSDGLEFLAAYKDHPRISQIPLILFSGTLQQPPEAMAPPFVTAIVSLVDRHCVPLP